jgi:hypothetical protein
MSEGTRDLSGGPTGAGAHFDFLGDWTEFLRQRLDIAGHPPLPSDDFRALALRYFNLQKRRFEARPREVRRSREFNCPADLLPIVDRIAEQSRKGEDLWPYLSRSITDPAYNDALLNDWEIHHFHLGAEVESDGFVERFITAGDPLLFARVTSDFLLFINTARHGDWGNQQLVEILHTNWPEILADCVLPRVKGLPCHLTDSGIKTVRKAGIDTVLQMSDGTVYGQIGSGGMTSGVAKDVMEASNQIQQLVGRLEVHVREHAHEYIDELAARGFAPEPPRFHLRMDESSAFIVEETVPTIAFRLGSLPTRLIL